jgi:hypothetical protein
MSIRPSRKNRRGGVSAEVTSVAVMTAVTTVPAADLAVHVPLLGVVRSLRDHEVLDRVRDRRAAVDGVLEPNLCCA